MGQDDPTSRGRPSSPAGGQQKDASKTPTVTMRPVRQPDPSTAPTVPDEPKPLARKSHELKPPPERRSDPASVMLKSSRLHQLLDQTARASPSKNDTGLLYDGLTPAKGASVIDPSRIVIAPLQSFPGQRTVTTTQSVINQYAVVANPRYLVRNVDPREAGALFVFDVMSSLNTTLGRAFLTSASGSFRPGTLAELWKWLSETALSVGWRVVEGKALWNALGQGLPVIATAETHLGRRVAVVEPGFPGSVPKPRLASAHEPRGQGQTPEDIFGTSVVRYLAHD